MKHLLLTSVFCAVAMTLGACDEAQARKWSNGSDRGTNEAMLDNGKNASIIINCAEGDDQTVNIMYSSDQVTEEAETELKNVPSVWQMGETEETLMFDTCSGNFCVYAPKTAAEFDHFAAFTARLSVQKKITVSIPSIDDTQSFRASNGGAAINGLLEGCKAKYQP